MNSFRITFRLSHLPTIGLLIGYVVYWLELYILKSNGGRTTPMAWAVWIFFSIFILFYRPRYLNDLWKSVYLRWSNGSFFLRVFIILSVAILLYAGVAAFLPPHLIQEFDALNYHITLPRQHLLWGSFAHIPWSSGDLFLLPIDFALAPFWLATPLPNKIPQFFFILALVVIVYDLVKKSSEGEDRFQSAFLAAVAVVSLHGLGIQFGTAMLDIVLCYLFFAFIHSLRDGNYFLAAIEFTFFFWAKAFIPFQFFLILMTGGIIVFGLNKIGFTSDWKQFAGKINTKFLSFFILLSIVIAGPFLVKSFYYAGTPVYPFFTKPASAVNPALNVVEPYKTLLHEAALVHLESKDHYGHGRSFWDFIKHLWLLGVPEKGPNNAFDYPVGLTYLLFVGPFLYWFGHDLRMKKINIIYIYITLYWMTWWFGSQQARFLYIPIVLMIVAVMSRPQPITKIFQFAVLLALALNCLSVFRAHQKSFFAGSVESVLRKKDKRLIAMGQSYAKEGTSGFVDVDYWDVAYARFPVIVSQKTLPWSMGMPVKENE